MFLDASAIVCMLTQEPEAPVLAARLKTASAPLTSVIAAYEATQAIARKRACTSQHAAEYLEEFLSDFGIRLVAVDSTEFRLAIQAHDRFGKGRHPARLNMGDCFAYACARTHGAPLLFKGEDFALTDIEAA